MKILSVLASIILGLFPTQNLGTAVPSSPALVDTTLAVSIDATQTSMTLTSGKLRNGADLIGFMCFTVDGNTPTVEYVCGNVSSTAVSAMVRGIDLMNPNVTSSALAFTHKRFASVQVTDYPTIQFITRKLNGLDPLDSPLRYSSSSPTFITANEQLASKDYVDSVGGTGGPDANETTRGIVELSTDLEASYGTTYGSTGARLVTPNNLFNSTSSAAILVPVAKSDGKISNTFLDFVSDGTPTSTTAVITGSNVDGSGLISTAITSSTIVFTNPTFTNIPQCLVSTNSTTTGLISTTTLTSVKFEFNTSMSGKTFYYMCFN